MTGYVICSVERSGSTYYSDLLQRTGLLGNPVVEPFNLRVESAAFCRHGFDSYDAYLEFVRNVASTSNGVYGINMMWRHVARLGEVLQHGREMVSQITVEELQRYFPELTNFVFTYRRDRLAQGVSWAIAYQTGRWRSNDPDLGRDPSYDFALVDALYQNVLADNLGWNTWFAMHGIEPLRIAYEDLVADPRNQVQRTFEYLGVSSPGRLSLLSQFEKQGSEMNHDWCERYRADIDKYNTTFPLPKRWMRIDKP